MVLKHYILFNIDFDEFESSVIFNGTQTPVALTGTPDLFESSVIFNGTQTQMIIVESACEFESSVIFNGTQTGR